MDQGKIFKDILKVFLKPLGFKKNGSRWHLYHEEVIVVIELLRSSWGPKYYLELGLYLRTLGESLTPKQVECHIRLSLTDLVVAEERAKIDAIFNLENPVSEKMRITEITNILKCLLPPFLASCTSLKDLSQHFKSGLFDHCFVHKDVALVIKEHKL